jgi:DNA repair protein RadA/Sms
LSHWRDLGLGDRDVFPNVVGGTLREPRRPALAAAIVSAERGVALPADAVYFGEVGLLGEVRPVGGSEARLREAASHGFRRAFLPRTDGLRRIAGLDTVEIATVEELVDTIR